MQRMIDHQYGRRHQTPEELSYLRGKYYQLEKLKHGGDRKSVESSSENRNLIPHF